MPMFSEDLQKLIDASLTDGVLTDKEREVIRKRALDEGVDPDELDILLDAEVQKLQQENESETRKVKKCPNCGEVIPTMAMKCAVCGYEFREQRANKIVEAFTKGRKSCKETFWNGDEEEVKFIQNFAIPNNAEDLIEMTIYLSSAVKNSSEGSLDLQNALRQKLQECHTKIDALYANDERFARLRETTKLNWWQRQTSVTKVLILMGAFFGFLIILMLIVPDGSKSSNKQEKAEKVEKAEEVEEVAPEPEETATPATEQYETEEAEEGTKATKTPEKTEEETVSEPVSDIEVDNAVDEAKEKTKSVFKKLKKKAADKVKKAAEKIDSKLSDEE